MTTTGGRRGRTTLVVQQASSPLPNSRSGGQRVLLSKKANTNKVMAYFASTIFLIYGLYSVLKKLTFHSPQAMDFSVLAKSFRSLECS